MINPDRESQIAELMNNNKINGVNIVTVADIAFKHFVLNWIISLNQNNYMRFVVFSFDTFLIKFLARHGFENHAVLVPREWLDYDVVSDDHTTRLDNTDYKQIVKSKTNIVYHLLARNHTVLFSDPDTVFLSEHVLNHVTYQHEHTFAEVLFSQEPIHRRIELNTGFLFAAPTHFSIRFFDALVRAQRLDSQEYLTQQGVLRKLLGEEMDPRIGKLDLVLYASGPLHFYDKLNDKLNITPLVVHANNLKNSAIKVNKLKSRNYWLVN
jgi:hypothetical protein